MNNVTLNLVIGVPNFQFKGTADPTNLGHAIAALSLYFQMDGTTNCAISNSMMTQQMRGGQYHQPGAAAAPQAEVVHPKQSDDLYVLTI